MILDIVLTALLALAISFGASKVWWFTLGAALSYRVLPGAWGEGVTGMLLVVGGMWARRHVRIWGS